MPCLPLPNKRGRLIPVWLNCLYCTRQVIEALYPDVPYCTRTSDEYYTQMMPNPESTPAYPGEMNPYPLK